MGTPSAEQAIAARQYFRRAMRQLFEADIPGNPVSVLAKEFLPAWQLIARKTALTRGGEHFSYYSAPEVRHRDAICRELRRDLIELWARRFRLTFDERPVKWICAYAVRCCKKWSNEPSRRHPTAINTTSGDHGSRLPEWIGGTVLPIADLHQHEGEPDADYRKRIRKSVTAWLNGRHRPLAPLVQRNVRSPKRDAVAHYRWLILRRCCGWDLDQIRAEENRHSGLHIATIQAISLGISRAERRLGIATTDPDAASRLTKAHRQA